MGWGGMGRGGMGWGRMEWSGWMGKDTYSHLFTVLSLDHRPRMVSLKMDFFA